jgi:hypothetical protein
MYKKSQPGTTTGLMASTNLRVTIAIAPAKVVPKTSAEKS